MEKWDTQTTAWIEELIKDYTNQSPENNLGTADGEKAWGEPVIGFSSGADPLYLELKADIGPFLWTPGEAFAQVYPDSNSSAADLTVISWILPQTEATKLDHRQQTVLPSERWIRSRSFGQDFNDQLARFVVVALAKAGFDAVAPSVLPQFSWNHSERYGYASNWSERHVAYVSGLGTFGLCDGLITAVGKAVRCGSVVVRAVFPATPRPYQNRQAYCLYHTKGTCKMCINRCPAGAISTAGHDKIKCRAYLNEVTAEYAKGVLKVGSYGCGLCQVKVPCESRIPLKLDPYYDGTRKTDWS